MRSFSHAYTIPAQPGGGGYPGKPAQNGVHYSAWENYNSELTTIIITNPELIIIPETFNINEDIEVLIIYRPALYGENNASGSLSATTGINETNVWYDNFQLGAYYDKFRITDAGSKEKEFIFTFTKTSGLKKGSYTNYRIKINVSTKDPTTEIINEGKDKIVEDNDVMVWLKQGDKEYTVKISGDKWVDQDQDLNTFTGFAHKIEDIPLDTSYYVSGNFDLSKPITFYCMRKDISTTKGVSFVENSSTKEYTVSSDTKEKDGYILTIGTIEFETDKIKYEANELIFNIETNNTDMDEKNHFCKFILNHKLTEEEIKEKAETAEDERLYRLTGIKYGEVSADLDKNLGEGELKLIVGDNVVNETATLKGLTSVDLPKDNRVRAWPDNTIGVFLYYKDKALVSGKFKEIIIIEEATGNKLATLTKDNLKADTEIVKASIEKEEFVKNVGSSMDAVKSLMTFNFSKSGTYTIKVIMETKKGSTTTLTTINIKLVISETANSSQELEGILGSGKNWLDTGLSGANKTLDTNKLMDLSNQLYNMFIIIAIAVAIIVGGILGIRYMTAGIDQKVQVKETLIPYAISCIVVFGAAGIWRLIVLLVQQI